MSLMVLDNRLSFFSSADSLFILISRELCGELKSSLAPENAPPHSNAQISDYLCPHGCFWFFHRVLQVEEAHQELPSCPAQVVRHLFMSPALTPTVLSHSLTNQIVWS